MSPFWRLAKVCCTLAGSERQFHVSPSYLLLDPDEKQFLTSQSLQACLLPRDASCTKVWLSFPKCCLEEIGYQELC